MRGKIGGGRWRLKSNWSRRRVRFLFRLGRSFRREIRVSKCILTNVAAIVGGYRIVVDPVGHAQPHGSGIIPCTENEVKTYVIQVFNSRGSPSSKVDACFHYMDQSRFYFISIHSRFRTQSGCSAHRESLTASELLQMVRRCPVLWFYAATATGSGLARRAPSSKQRIPVFIYTISANSTFRASSSFATVLACEGVERILVFISVDGVAQYSAQ